VFECRVEAWLGAVAYSALVNWKVFKIASGLTATLSLRGT
jgi:hypothetical protein